MFVVYACVPGPRGFTCEDLDHCDTLAAARCVKFDLAAAGEARTIKIRTVRQHPEAQGPTTFVWDC